MADFDEDASKRRIEEAARTNEKRLEAKRLEDLEASQRGIKITRHGAYKVPQKVDPGKPEVFRITRSSPMETIQEFRVTNKDGSRQATLPLNKEWLSLFGEKTSIFVIGVAGLGQLELMSVYVSNDKNNPWGT